VIEGQPDLVSFKDWLGLAASDTEDDVVLQNGLDAALQAQALVVAYPVTLPETDPPALVFTPDLITAIYLRAQRYAARRNSPESVVGLTGTDGDFVGARLPAGDPDVARLEGPYMPIVSA
jgi:hypothetical protein